METVKNTKCIVSFWFRDIIQKPVKAAPLNILYTSDKRLWLLQIYQFQNFFRYHGNLVKNTNLLFLFVSGP